MCVMAYSWHTVRCITNRTMDKQITDNSWIKRKYRRYIVVAVIVVLAILLLFFAGGSQGVRIDINNVSIETVFKAQFNDYIQVTGLAAPIATVYLDAMEGGRVEEIFIEEGAMVRKGDVILRLSNRDLNLSILNSEAQLAEKSNYLRETRLQMEQNKLTLEREMVTAGFDLTYKKRLYEHNASLFQQHMIAREEMQHSEETFQLAEQIYEMVRRRRQQDSLFRNLQIEQLNSNLENMQRNLKIVKEQVDFLNVKAPLDGQLGMLDAEVGQSIARGARLGQINVLTSFKVEADVDEHYIDRIKAGLYGYIDKEGDTSRLQVRKVYPDVRNGRFRIDLVFRDTLPANIRTGQTYYIRLELGQPIESVQIPKGGFFQNTGGQWIFVLDQSEQTAVRRNIRIGRQNPQFYEVLDGLQPGEKVITSGYEAMGDNVRVILK
jgi:HlyD family secretion protein